MIANILYMIRFLRSLLRGSSLGRAVPVRVLFVTMVVASGTTLTAYAVADEPAASAEVEALLARAERVSALLRTTETVWADHVAPIDRVLRTYRDEPRLTSRIAATLVREARATGIEPRLLLAVLLVENPWLDPQVLSPVAAVGQMQVMPFHRGEWEGCGDSLEDIDSNICHGAKIFASYLASAKGDVDRALLRYNGCVKGTNTPDCHLYPQHVYARAGRASVLAWRNAQGTSAP
jgi:soluble lytic murein transglycosylase-like protein